MPVNSGNRYIFLGSFLVINRCGLIVVINRNGLAFPASFSTLAIFSDVRQLPKHIVSFRNLLLVFEIIYLLLCIFNIWCCIWFNLVSKSSEFWTVAICSSVLSFIRLTFSGDSSCLWSSLPSNLWFKVNGNYKLFRKCHNPWHYVRHTKSH